MLLTIEDRQPEPAEEVQQPEGELEITQPEVSRPEKPILSGGIDFIEMMKATMEEVLKETNKKIEDGQKESQKNIESLKEGLNNKIDETKKKTEESINQKTEELLTKNMEIIRENLSAELGVKIDETNKKIDEMNEKINTEIELMKSDSEKIWLQMADNSYRTEEIARNTIETIDKKFEENLEATEGRMAVMATEIQEEMSEIRREGEINKQKIVQTETDLSNRIDSLEETRNKQIEVIERQQTEMVVAHTTLGEKCEEITTTVNAVKHQVNNDRDQLNERQQREFSDIRDEMNRLRAYPNLLAGLPHLDGREHIDFRAYTKNPLEFLKRVDEVPVSYTHLLIQDCKTTDIINKTTKYIIQKSELIVHRDQ